MKLNTKNYEEIFKGFFIIGCAVRKKDMVYFLLEEEYDSEKNTPDKKKIRTRIATCYDEPNPKDVWSFAGLRGMHRTKAGIALKPKEQFVGVSMNDHVYVIGSGVSAFEKDLVGGPIAGGKLVGQRGALSKMRTIDGWLWIAGSGRTVGRRLGPDNWEWHDDIPHKSLMEDGGFRDIDGFSSTDIYAAGGHGDVWHYDGKKWKQVAFPSNMTLETICCAGDGQVYIGAEQGTVFKGRDSQWKRIYKGDMALPYKNMVWHQGKVWCTSDYGLWTIEKDKIQEADVPDAIRTCAGHLSVGDGVMLLAGMYGASLHDGKEWRSIIDYNDLR
jgi:hypothetical protein